MVCDVLPGFFGFFIQFLLFVACVLTLAYKKSRDRMRTWAEFLLDSSKQLLGAAWIHVLNLVFAQQLEATLQSGDECEWYWVNIMVDTTLGVGVEYVLLSLIMGALIRCLGEDAAADFESGSYYDGRSPSFDRYRYLKQLLVWGVVVSGMKLSMLLLMVLAAQQLQALAHFMLMPFFANSSIKLLVVMIVTPMIMNSFQFWVVDNIIKKKVDDEDDLLDVPHDELHQSTSSTSSEMGGLFRPGAAE
eukprot:NODE_12494_length_1221_cov_9.744973.p1 GENE.NODE_12494_length_1221_cov_9.744973~~NODE_12494_length_1221_cov_9.744973.p1  ORF type:complete len:246 (+),score=71.70 NODE_12494_length_1221_cov_9.744973:121-858(+)